MSGRWATSPRATKAIPALTAGLLLALPLTFPNSASVGVAGRARQAAVAVAVAHAPYRIGPWVGVDIPVPPAATKLLHPNAVLSRRFERIDRGSSVSMLLVHCTDARDMRGHYPPACYPYSGWLFADAKRGREMAVTVHGRPVPVRVYEFRRIGADGREMRIRVLSVFILPDGTLTPDIDQINSLSERIPLSVQGVAQMQIVTSAAMTDEETTAAAREIFEGMSQLWAAFDVWKEGDNVYAR